MSTMVSPGRKVQNAFVNERQYDDSEPDMYDSHSQKSIDTFITLAGACTRKASNALATSWEAGSGRRHAGLGTPSTNP